MSFMDKILIIETSDVGAAYTALAVKKLGYEPVFLANLLAYQGDTLNQLKANTHYNLFDTSKTDAILETIQSKNISNIAAVISLLDSRIKVASELGLKLGVPSNDHACSSSLHNKARVQELIPEFCLPSIIFSQKNIPYVEIQSFLKTHHKLIVKPTTSAGSIGVFTLANEHSLDQLNSLINKQMVQADEWIAQKFVNGVLVSLEGFVKNRILNLIGFSERLKFQGTEAVSVFPVFIKEETVRKAEDAIRALINRSNYMNGYFHSEFILTNETCFLVDANFGRVGGGGVSEQLAIAFGKNPVEIYAHIVDITLFHGQQHSEKSIYDSITPIQTTNINYGLMKPTMVYNIELPTSKNFYHTQVIENNSFAPLYGENNLSWIGMVSSKSENIYQEVDQIKIITPNGIEKPYYPKHVSTD